MMRLLISACLLFGIAGHSHCQTTLDTLFFDSFDDNSDGWPLTTPENIESSIEDGMMRYKVRQTKKEYTYRVRKLPPASQDTFLYEIRIYPEQMLMVGMVFGLKKHKKKKMYTDYQSLAVMENRVLAYEYSTRNADGPIHQWWFKKLPDLDEDDLILRVTSDGKFYHYFLNGQWIKKTKIPYRSEFREWGFILRGYGEIYIDYMLVMGKILPPEED